MPSRFARETEREADDDIGCVARGGKGPVAGESGAGRSDTLRGAGATYTWFAVGAIGSIGAIATGRPCIALGALSALRALRSLRPRLCDLGSDLLDFLFLLAVETGHRGKRRARERCYQRHDCDDQAGGAKLVVDSVEHLVLPPLGLSVLMLLTVSSYCRCRATLKHLAPADTWY